MAGRLDDAQFFARQGSRHQGLADDVRGQAELAEWERLAQLPAAAPAGTVHDPDADRVRDTGAGPADRACRVPRCTSSNANGLPPSVSPSPSPANGRGGDAGSSSAPCPGGPDTADSTTATNGTLATTRPSPTSPQLLFRVAERAPERQRPLTPTAVP
ncbi:hypothetical protein FEF34_05305 [Streptomyces marianii]|uniref:Uncharacterized protein n=1 Tax=Streptomyces marianii TaxID=1817406 RepID=A0A5R9DYG5_9ACTN|nr:hypothetical protein FEF34_05305 [Streptomyces marianii]